MRDVSSHIGIASVLSAGVIWGFLGLFVRGLADYGFTPIQMTCIRYVVVALFLGAILLFISPASLRIDRKSVLVFFIMGVFGSALNSIFYFQSMNMISIGLATILQYISPFVVVLFSILLFREKLTHEKTIALIVAFAGCILCTGILTDFGSVNIMGILFGALSGLCYSMYTIGSKIASCKYGILTITFYSSLFSGIILIPFSDLSSATDIMVSSLDASVLMLGLIFLMTLLPFSLYNVGVSKMDAGKASIITYIEPVVSTIVGFCVYNEAITLVTVLGITMVLASLILINRKPTCTYSK